MENTELRAHLAPDPFPPPQELLWGPNPALDTVHTKLAAMYQCSEPCSDHFNDLSIFWWNSVKI